MESSVGKPDSCPVQQDYVDVYLFMRWCKQSGTKKWGLTTLFLITATRNIWDRQTIRQASRQTDRQAVRQTDRQASKQTNRLADRQPDSQTDKAKIKYGLGVVSFSLTMQLVVTVQQDFITPDPTITAHNDYRLPQAALTTKIIITCILHSRISCSEPKV